ncbi:hypothetical protein [Streptomyces sp. NPDC059398]|uniref:hypothetical protein n=1 Tax=Streptomyces sp. NPDC059398 TaxID=3346820 RepID=UPI0036BC4922
MLLFGARRLASAARRGGPGVRGERAAARAAPERCHRPAGLVQRSIRSTHAVWDEPLKRAQSFPSYICLSG